MYIFFRQMRTILTFAAIVPAIILLIHVMRKDKLEKESPFFILTLVVWGILSTFAAMILERLGSFILSFFFTSQTVLYNVIMYYVVVAMSEEGSKYYLLRKKTWNSPEFNCQYDAVVYAVAVSMGFALWENLIYVFRYGISTAIVRALTAVPGHASFGVIMGVWYGLERRYNYWGNWPKKKVSQILAFLLPVFMHGTYDFLCTSLYGWQGSVVFVVFIIILFSVSWHMVNKASANDRHL